MKIKYTERMVSKTEYQNVDWNIPIRQLRFMYAHQPVITALCDKLIKAEELLTIIYKEQDAPQLHADIEAWLR